MVGRRLLRWCCASLMLAGLALSPAGAAPAPVRLGDDDRLLVLAPHPNDETLAAGGLIQEAAALGLPVRVCYFSMGDNNEIAYLFTRHHPVDTPGAMRSQGARRLNEAIAAARQLGLATNDVVFLGYPDSCTLDVWNGHWRTVPPLQSMLTRAHAVPYAQALTPGSAYAGEDVLDDLAEVVRDFRPTLLVMPHPADHNVDHRALALFARVALWHLEADGIRPEILAAPVHFTDWPRPRRAAPERPAVPPAFLEGQIEWREYALAPFQATNKLAALRRHHSQYGAAAAYLDSFVRKTELFGNFADLALPNGAGNLDVPEEDVSQFRPDQNFFAELASQSEQWNAIADQSAAESRQLGGRDNDFIGRTVSGDGTHLTVSFQFLQPVSPSAVLVATLFGYRPDVPFGEMPKLAIETTPRGIVSVKDLDARLPADAVEWVPDGDDEIKLRVSLALLGNPGKILAGAQLLDGRLPVDWVPWRIVDLALPAAVPARAPTEPPAAESTRMPEAAGEQPAPPAPPNVARPPAPTSETPTFPPPPVAPPAKPAPPPISEADEPVYW